MLLFFLDLFVIFVLFSANITYSYQAETSLKDAEVADSINLINLTPSGLLDLKQDAITYVVRTACKNLWNKLEIMVNDINKTDRCRIEDTLHIIGPQEVVNPSRCFTI